MTEPAEKLVETGAVDSFGPDPDNARPALVWGSDDVSGSRTTRASASVGR